MCSSEKCTWPVGHEDLIIMNRPLGKEWSKTWDESAAKYLKSEHDLMVNFSCYTPPQTPNSEAFSKDTSNHTHTSISDKAVISLPVIKKESVPKELSKPSDLFSNVNSRVDNKPKVVISKFVNYKLEKLSSKGYALKKTSKSNDQDPEPKLALNSNNIKSNDTNVPTSLISNVVSVNNGKKSPILSLVVEEKSKSGIRLLRGKKRSQHYEKFDFNKLMKSKSVKLEQITIVKKDSKEALKSSANTSSGFNKSHSNEMLNLESTNASSAWYKDDVSQTAKVEVVDNNQFDFNSILGLNNNSKDAGVDKDTVYKDELDLQLDELLSVFSDETINNNTVKNQAYNTEEDEWINTLFD